MKILSAIFAIIMLMVVNASAETKQVPADQVEAYKKAFAPYMKNELFTCKALFGNWVSPASAIQNPTSIEIDESGAQPVLIFKMGDANKYSVSSVTTSADYKTIVSIKGEKFEIVTEETNTGDLRNPKIETKTFYKLTGATDCTFN